MYLEKLQKALKPTSEEQGANAAIVLLLRAAGEDFEVLLVKRVENPTDHWSGQVALPGGKRDENDEALKQTIIRETREETSVDLLRDCRFLGVMPASTSAGRRVKVLPFVVFLEREVSIGLEKGIGGFAWVRLGDIGKGRGTARFSFGKVPAFLVDGYVVWGLTYRILDDFIRVLELA